MVQSARRLTSVDDAGGRSRDELTELMEAVQRGDRPAFAALYDRLAPSAFGLARRVVRAPARAEEVARRHDPPARLIGGDRVTDADLHIHLFAGAYALDALRTPQLPPVAPTSSSARVWLDRNVHRVAAVLAVLAIAVGGANLWAIQAADPPAGEETTLATWLQDARSVARDAPRDASMLWMWSDAANEGILAVQGLPAAGPGEDYQLWLFHDGQPVPAGVFDPAEGLQMVRAEAPARGAEVVAVTVEPDGGVPQPTSQPIASVELPGR